MKYFIIILILIPILRLLAYGRYEKKNNRLAYIGINLLALVTFAFSVFVTVIK